MPVPPISYAGETARQCLFERLGDAVDQHDVIRCLQAAQNGERCNSIRLTVRNGQRYGSAFRRRPEEVGAPINVVLRQSARMMLCIGMNIAWNGVRGPVNGVTTKTTPVHPFASGPPT